MYSIRRPGGCHYDVGCFGQSWQLIVLDTTNDGLDDQMGMDGQRPGMFRVICSASSRVGVVINTCAAPALRAEEIEEIIAWSATETRLFYRFLLARKQECVSRPSIAAGITLLLDGGRTDKALLGDGAQQDGAVEGIEGHEG